MNPEPSPGLPAVRGMEQVMRRIVPGMVIAGLLLALAAPTSAEEEVAVSLRGSPASMLRQNAIAKELELAFVATPAQLRELASAGVLVRLEGNDDYGFGEWMDGGIARPELRTFIERLSSQYRAACGEKLIVTSLTRPESQQPRNSHPLSVHPAGIAVDLRVSRSADCRAWLEGTLLALERAGLLDVTRERYPPHYHVAIFPHSYMAHVARLLAAGQARADSIAAAEAAARPRIAVASLAARPERTAGSGGPPWALAALPLVAAVGLAALRRVGSSAD